jgi:Transposase DDE domain
MSLDDFIIACFCTLDDLLTQVLKGKRVRTCGPQPKLADSEVLTMEVVGSYLGLSQDQAIDEYFKRHSVHLFPQIASVHRSTFVRQAAHLWTIKEHLWCELPDKHISYDPTIAIVDSLPVPVCRFARSSRCVRFRGIASYGKDHSDKQTFYGFLLHVRLSWSGCITRVFLAPANEQDFEIVPLLTSGTHGLALGVRTYWVPPIQQEVRRQGVLLQAPFRRAHSPQAKTYESPVLGRVRYLIDTVFGQLADRCHIKRLWARELWHLCSRLVRLILMHSLCLFCNQQDYAPLLQLDRLGASQQNLHIGFVKGLVFLEALITDFAL